MLETKDRTAFLNGIDDEQLKSEVAFIINDDDELTAFALQTAAADMAMERVTFNNLKPGQTINRITIKSLIGKGGMGRVYLGYDETLKRNVAIKSIRSEYLANEATQKRFVQEAQILSQINHPSICQIYDYIESDSGNLLVLEWIDGQTLSGVKLNPTQAMQVLTSLASALKKAHSKGIIHRDLKPENIMITHDNHIKVLDFGIAQSVSDIREDHSPIGTLRYMSPEQAKGDTVGLHSDIYAFGLIMSELLSGQDCYHYHDTDSLLSEVVKANVQLPKNIKKSHAKIIKQCVSKIPEERPTADHLVKLLSHQEKKIHRWKIALLLILLSLSVLLTLHFWQQNQSSLAFAEFDQRIDGLHDRLLQVETLPAHDTTAKRESIQQNANNILSDIKTHSVLSDYEKKHLEGKLHFYNRAYPLAVKSLTLAYQLNPGNKALISLYVQALGQNYFLTLSQNIEDTNKGQENNSVLVSASQELKNKLSQLKASYQLNDKNVLPLLSATEHIIKENFDEAVKAIVSEKTKLDGRYGDYYLAGIIKRQQGLRAFYQAEYANAIKHLTESIDFFKSSNNIARSYIGNYYEFCYLSAEILKTHQFHSKEISNNYHQAMSLCEQGLIVNPKDQYIMAQLATINWRYGQWLLTHGKVPDEYFQQSLSWGERSLSLSENAPAWENQGIVHDLIALQKLEQGSNPLPHLKKAMAAYDRVKKLNPTQITQTTGNQLYALNIKSQYQLLVGEDVAETAQSALELVKHAQQHQNYQLAQASNIYNNFAYIALLAAFSDFNYGRDHLKWLNQSKSFYKGIETELGNTSLFAAGGLAEAHWFNAEVSSSKQQPFDTDLSIAINQIDHALSLSRQYYWMPLTKSKTLLLKVKTGLSSDEENELAIAKNLLDESVTLNPKYAETHLVLGYWHHMKLVRAQDIDAINHHYQQGLSHTSQASLINQLAAEPWLLKLKLLELAKLKGLDDVASESELLTWKQTAMALNPYAKIWQLPLHLK